MKLGRLRPPDSVIFASLDWEEHPFLLSQILSCHRSHHRRRPGQEVGIEPESVDLIRMHGVTTEMLRKWIGLDEDAQEDVATSEPSDLEGR